MSGLLNRFWFDESGPEMIEWAVVTIILLVATTWVLIRLRVTLIDIFASVFSALQTPPPDSY